MSVFVDDVDIVACWYSDSKEIFDAVDKSEKNMGLRINKNEMKYMVVVPQIIYMTIL